MLGSLNPFFGHEERSHEAVEASGYFLDGCFLFWMFLRAVGTTNDISLE